jgi:hypothetical protein
VLRAGILNLCQQLVSGGDGDYAVWTCADLYTPTVWFDTLAISKQLVGNAS